jgi:cytochrome P450
VATPNPPVDELNALTYLDSVVRETMRLHSPVPLTVRLATEDDVLPLQTPVVDKFEKLHHEIR